MRRLEAKKLIARLKCIEEIRNSIQAIETNGDDANPHTESDIHVVQHGWDWDFILVFQSYLFVVISFYVEIF